MKALFFVLQSARASRHLCREGQGFDSLNLHEESSEKKALFFVLQSARASRHLCREGQGFDSLNLHEESSEMKVLFFGGVLHPGSSVRRYKENRTVHRTNCLLPAHPDSNTNRPSWS
jgi:hypothetical protein